MISISHIQHYISHELNMKYYSIKIYRNGYSVSFVCRRYIISKSSLMHWNRNFDGTKKSLIDKSHRPLSNHLNVHLEEELFWIRNYIRRNLNIFLCEHYGKLRVSKYACSLFWIIKKT